MTDRYIVTEKATGKELLNMEFIKADEAISEMKKLFAAGTKPEDIDVKIDPGEGLPPVPVTDEQLAKMVKARKHRSDTGKPHNKQESGKKVRNRRQFFAIPAGEVRAFTTRQELEKYLDLLERDATDRVIQGHELKFERKVQFTLKTVKS